MSASGRASMLAIIEASPGDVGSLALAAASVPGGLPLPLVIEVIGARDTTELASRFASRWGLAVPELHEGQRLEAGVLHLAPSGGSLEERGGDLFACARGEKEGLLESALRLDPDGLIAVFLEEALHRAGARAQRVRESGARVIGLSPSASME